MLYQPTDKAFKCRYKFPESICSDRTIVKCSGEAHLFDAKIMLRRNDSRLTNYNEYLRKGFRMNMDCTIAPGIKAIRYLASYIFSRSKSLTLTLKDLKTKLNSLIERDNGIDTVYQFFSSCLIKMMSSKTLCQQQALHLLQQLPVTKCDYSFQSVCLGSSRRIINGQIDLNLYDFYLKRHEYAHNFNFDLKQMNLYKKKKIFSIF